MYNMDVQLLQVGLHHGITDASNIQMIILLAAAELPPSIGMQEVIIKNKKFRHFTINSFIFSHLLTRLNVLCETQLRIYVQPE